MFYQFSRFDFSLSVHAFFRTQAKVTNGGDEWRRLNVRSNRATEAFLTAKEGTSVHVIIKRGSALMEIYCLDRIEKAVANEDFLSKLYTFGKYILKRK